ncbi:hypothetical protein ACF0H5_010818 [Mactra antiquata]
MTISTLHKRIGSLESNEKFTAGKGADYRNPLLPIQMPRGYGGVAVMWKKHYSSFITVLSDGSERVQCVNLGNKGNNSREIWCWYTFPVKVMQLVMMTFVRV